MTIKWEVFHKCREVNNMNALSHLIQAWMETPKGPVLESSQCKNGIGPVLHLVQFGPGS